MSGPSSTVLADVERRVAAQAEALAADPVVQELRGEVHQNNYVLMLPRSGVSAEEHEHTIGNELAELNSADAELLGHMDDTIDRLALDTEDQRLARRMLQAWRSDVDAGANLAGAMHATALLHALHERCDMTARLRAERPDIVEHFCGLSPAVTEVTRLNWFLPPVIAQAVVPTLLLALDDASCLSVVERIEVAKQIEELPSAMVPAYPTLMVYLDTPRPLPGRCGVESDRDTVVRFDGVVSVVRRLSSQLAPQSLPERTEASITEMSLRLAPTANVTQGFRLLKRYLAGLDLLDRVYDPRSGYVPVRSPVTLRGHWVRALVVAKR